MPEAAAEPVDAAALADLPLPAIGPRLRAGPRLALARACGVRAQIAAEGAAEGTLPHLRVHDALAGWGTDGLVLAALGCDVHMSERQPLVYQRLAQRLQADVPASAGTVTAALEDARERWGDAPTFEVIYLDPMFGPHPKTAQPARCMQVLAELAEPVEDLGAMVAQACRHASGRVVVKRRRHAPAVGEPTWRIAAKSVRFDVYARR